MQFTFIHHLLIEQLSNEKQDHEKRSANLCAEQFYGGLRCYSSATPDVVRVDSTSLFHSFVLFVFNFTNFFRFHNMIILKIYWLKILPRLAGRHTNPIIHIWYTQSWERPCRATRGAHFINIGAIIRNYRNWSFQFPNSFKYLSWSDFAFNSYAIIFSTCLRLLLLSS